MQPDYPAAHSMDTGWFAVDRDGHVAQFYSGEAGAVPEGAATHSEEWTAFLRTLPLSEISYDARGRIRPGSDPERQRHQVRADFNHGASLVFLRSLDPVQAELQNGSALRVAAEEGVAVIFRSIPEEVLRRLHEGGHCQSCFRIYPSNPEDETEYVRAQPFFNYDHLTDNWISGPYGRRKVPVKPLHVDQLPPRLRDALKQTRFDLRFSETPHIQPVEHVPCASWESAYMDVTGKHIRPIPGHEENYADNYDELAEISDGIEVQPPADSTAENEE